ncbi:hypothetical protein PSYPI_35615, partial [Pseudomonas syringae pv. pisi str. 1704B]
MNKANITRGAKIFGLGLVALLLLVVISVALLL